MLRLENKETKLEPIKNGETVTTIEAVVSEKEIERTLRKIVKILIEKRE